MASSADNDGSDDHGDVWRRLRCRSQRQMRGAGSGVTDDTGDCDDGDAMTTAVLLSMHCSCASGIRYQSIIKKTQVEMMQ